MPGGSRNGGREAELLLFFFFFSFFFFSIAAIRSTRVIKFALLRRLPSPNSLSPRAIGGDPPLTIQVARRSSYKLLHCNRLRGK